MFGFEAICNYPSFSSVFPIDAEPKQSNDTLIMSSPTDRDVESFRLHILNSLADIKECTDFKEDTLEHFENLYDGKFASFPGQPFTARRVFVSFDGSTVVAEIDGIKSKPLKISQFKSLVEQGKVTLSDHE